MHDFIINKWRDCATITAIIALIILSIIVDYNFGMFVGFLLLIIFLAFERIKLLVFDLNIKKIYGIEFRENLKEEVREKVQEGRPGTDTELIDLITETTLNNISGSQYPALTYEGIVSYAIENAGIPYQTNLLVKGTNKTVQIDFLATIDHEVTLGIEAAYTNNRYLHKSVTDRTLNIFNESKSILGLKHFLLITNATITLNDQKKLKEQVPSIDYIDKALSPEDISSKLREYIKHISANT